MPDEVVVKFIPFSSTVDAPFWVQYCHQKLETIRLDESPRPIQASYGVHLGTTPKASDAVSKTVANRLQCVESSLFPDESLVSNDRVACPGILYGYNTKESFQTLNKNGFLKDFLIERFLTEDHSSLEAPQFVVITFADLKQHKVLYWFGFPTFMANTPITASIVPTKKEVPVSLTETETETETEIDTDTASEWGPTAVWWRNLAEGLYRYRERTDAMPAYFTVPTLTRDGEPLEISLVGKDSVSSGEEEQPLDIVVGFVDPTAIVGSSNSSKVLTMGWPMRNLVAYLVLRLGLGGKRVRILSLRPGGCPGLRGRVLASEGSGEKATPSKLSGVDGERLAKHSVLMTVKLPLREDYSHSISNSNSTSSEKSQEPCYKVVGWELNARQKPGPRWVNLKPLLDQSHIAIQAADLNLKLMKWRMIPDLDVDLLQNNCRVLLLGAGTLGCSVARTLLGWGIRHFTFVDYGNVSYSNPVRQILFDLDDCHFDHGQGKPKAEAAATALRKIAADVVSEGVRLSIPMPGHPSENDASLRETTEKLDELIRNADAVFLLTDTRESRWLPTVMAAHHDKILINAALGLDSWLVMRHGHHNNNNDGGDGDGSSGAGVGVGVADESKSRLGCYFCNDVVAPENSTRNRTLDQQCTVTRPGLAPIASSMAVELLISLLHHPLKQRAPAPTSGPGFSLSVESGSGSGSGSSPLGLVPHQIRGSIVTYTMMNPSVPAFPCCTACSLPVLEAYKDDPFALVSAACASVKGEFLDRLSGLDEFRARALDTLDDLDFPDDDDFELEDEEEVRTEPAEGGAGTESAIAVAAAAAAAPQD
mmetsp:Transcript_26705/g.73460  ORF Transcript_26705/g.73460 Transcript_26705/m.73460 type:complete len:821 (+) Transcript_26705:308-2770(+)